jgi:hypothetical protein
MSKIQEKPSIVLFYALLDPDRESGSGYESRAQVNPDPNCSFSQNVVISAYSLL